MDRKDYCFTTSEEKWRDYYFDVQNGKKKKLSSEQAYDHAIRAAIKLGGDKPVSFENKPINSTINYLHGWPLFVQSAKRKDDKYRERFIKLYELLSESIGGHPDSIDGLDARGVSVRLED